MYLYTFVCVNNLKLRTHFEITDKTNLKVNSRCLTLQCGLDRKFLNYACNTSLPTICSSLGKVIYSLIVKQDNYTLSILVFTKNVITIQTGVFVNYVYAHVIMFEFSYLLNYQYTSYYVTIFNCCFKNIIILKFRWF